MSKVTITLAQDDPELWDGIHKAKREAARQATRSSWANQYAGDVQILLVYIAQLEADLGLPIKE